MRRRPAVPEPGLLTRFPLRPHQLTHAVTSLEDVFVLAEHGAPVRLLVPGFYGTNSVKWLYRLTLADRRFAGPMTAVFYNEASPPSAQPSREESVPVWEIAPESVIVAPEPDARCSQCDPRGPRQRRGDRRGRSRRRFAVRGFEPIATR